MSEEASIPRDMKSMLRIIGVQSNLDDPTYFDLLSISESETDPKAIQARVRERTKALRKYEQYRKDPAVQKLATSLMAQVSNAGRVLRDPARRAEYVQTLRAQGVERFRERLMRILKPGHEVVDAQMQQFLAFAAQCGVSEAEAKDVIANLTRAKENQFAPLGVELWEDDPAWPTAFEVLGCSENFDDDAVQAAAQKRLAMLESSSASDTERNFLRRYVNEAARTLASKDARDEYRQDMERKRRKRFQKAIARACPAGERPDQRVVMHLIQLAQRMRIPSSLARSAISEQTGFDDFGTDEPALSITPAQIATSVLPDGTDCKHPITVRNEGSGKLEAVFTPEVSWLRVEPMDCATETSCDVVLEILPSGLFPGKPETGTVHVDGNGGSATITVQTRLGAGDITEPESWEIRMAKRAYQMCFAQILIIVHALVLLMMFMNHRNRSPYVAFHCMQSLLLSVPCIAFLFVAMYFIAPSGAPAASQSCFSMCIVPLLVILALFGWPGIMAAQLDKRPYLFVPIIGKLARRLT